MKYNKLVRDKIPERIKSKSKTPITHIADNEEYWIKLKEKLKEEADEFLEESDKQELADILEVIYAIADFKKISREDLEEMRDKKKKERGGFNERIILEKIL